ncbi:DUF3396 domain-containing protein [Archangium lipolyticum]|uniref:DUF3396 domain-containing protein n=1 Tax=Archangium lipolyticum TaxID=2970465 RepID=UPI00214A6E53|nr:DUF3396 domain-containing protein [Archangium lipolyticum]
MREVFRLVLHLPFDHHDLANPVSRALEVYLRAVGTGAEVFSEYNLGYEPNSLHEGAWARIRSTLSPPVGERFLDDLSNEDVYPYVKRQFERMVELSGGDKDVSGYGFFYLSRLPWRSRARVEDEVSLVSFSWPTEYLEEHGPGKMRELAMALASLLPFSSGHAGLAFYSPNTFCGSMKGIHEESFRYPGMDVSHGIRKLGSRVDGVHWLNFLGQPVLGEMGGAAGLRAQLHSPGTTVQALEGEKAVVTLGQWPEAGDLTRGQDLPAYRELARVLEPWLYECPSYYDFDDASHEETLRWWRRFLD